MMPMNAQEVKKSILGSFLSKPGASDDGEGCVLSPPGEEPAPLLIRLRPDERFRLCSSELSGQQQASATQNHFQKPSRPAPPLGAAPAGFR